MKPENRSGRSVSYRRGIFALMLVAVLVSFELGLPPKAVIAQTRPAWDKPIQLYAGGADDFLFANLVCDPFGQVHGFWGNRMSRDEPFAIYHAIKDEQGWSVPVDIILGASRPTGAVDSKGILHLIWQDNGLFHSAAPALAAQSARSWQQSKPIAPSIRILSSTMIMDREDRIHVAYAIGEEPYTIYYGRSDDGGTSWTSPVIAGEPSSPQASAYEPRLHMDDSGVLHMVYTDATLPSGWPPRGVYYAQSTDLGETWSAPFQMAGDNHATADIASLGRQIIAVWNATAEVGGRYYRVSEDGGLTWSETLKLVPDGYTGVALGHPKLVKLTEDRMALIMSATNQLPGGRMPDMIYYAEWQDNKWTNPELISSEDMVSQLPSACLGLGNELHVVWSPGNKIYYTRGNLDLPGWSAMPTPSLATAKPELISSPTPIPTVPMPKLTELRTTSSSLSVNSLESERPPSQATALILGGLPAVLLVLVVFVGNILKRKSRR